MSDKPPQTFEEWRRKTITNDPVTGLIGDYSPGAAWKAAFAAGVASQQAELDRMRKFYKAAEWEFQEADRLRAALAEKDREIERLKHSMDGWQAHDELQAHLVKLNAVVEAARRVIDTANNLELSADEAEELLLDELRAALAALEEKP